MRTKPPAQLPIFRSDLQARLLAILVEAPDDWHGSRELIERTGASPAGLQRELARLREAGMIEHETVGRAKRHRLAPDSPIREPLAELVRRTVGVEAQLRRTLVEIDGIELALIHGSWANGRIDSMSDIDVVVVGDVDYDLLLDGVRSVEQVAGREIQVKLYGTDEFAARRHDAFLATVLRRPTIELIGSTEELSHS